MNVHARGKLRDTSAAHFQPVRTFDAALVHLVRKNLIVVIIQRASFHHHAIEIFALKQAQWNCRSNASLFVNPLRHFARSIPTRHPQLKKESVQEYLRGALIDFMPLSEIFLLRKCTGRVYFVDRQQMVRRPR